MTRARAEDGFTLMEVIVAMAVGFVLLGALLGLLESSVRLNTGVMAKTDAMQRGRVAMDAITQQLRSQVCFDWENSAIRAGSDANTVEFYADYTAEGEKPVKRRLSYDAATRRILSYRYDAPTPTPNPFTPASYPSSPAATNMVLENVGLQQPEGASVPTPFLRYFAYEEVDGVLRADRELTPPLDAAEAARAARVEISYFVLPTGSSDAGKGVNLSDQVMARHADPNLAVPDPNCV